MRFWFSLSTFVFAVGFTLMGISTLDLFDFNGRPGPGYFPLIIGMGLVICTSINVFKDGKNRHRISSSDGDEKSLYISDTVVMVACISLLVFTLNFLGAVLSMVAFCMSFLAYFNRGKHWQNGLYSLAFPLCVYLLFDVWLQAGLPDGLLRSFF
ncbi:tripartite tricarboxylate transporter TctB family protein [Vibrio sonorensis]|uniref:tripartite tricarboxylate transporter TctB family protein n=1 Tax=Vibrio sonorensis TaxID=1004316 RepID=UPI0008D96863|nr:tripartite tricarboxylate transporter TctB family protein [Vibrio sonorensis]